jgi:uncharacterized phage-like protein YoqJ
MIVSFSGHRPQKIGGFITPNPMYNYLTKELRKVLEELKPTKAISGMALGWDTWTAQMCIELGIPFVAAIPFIGQERIWPQKSKDIYNDLLKKASEVVIVSEGGYSAYKMQVRNQWMTDRCDKLIACWDGSSGGTGNCVDYARTINKEIIIIDPRKAIS